MRAFRVHAARLRDLLTDEAVGCTGWPKQAMPTYAVVRQAHRRRCDEPGFALRSTTPYRPEETSMHDLGTMLGGYEIVRQVTPEGITTTYEARARAREAAGRPATTSHRRVALHVSHPLTTPEDSARAEIFQRDAVAMSEIAHPAIAKVVDVGRDGDRVFIATTWTDFVTLDDLIAERGQLSPDDTLILMGDLASALDVLHAHGLVHGALSPHTIWIERRGGGPGTALFTSVSGASLAAGRLQAGRGGDDASLLKTALYTAPEQLRGDEVGGPADQYALACALHHCLTGEPPFVRDTLPALIGAHLFARPATLAGETPAVQRALTVGMAKQPTDRHPSCSHLLRETRVSAPAGASRPTSAAGTATDVATGSRSPRYEAPRLVMPAWFAWDRRPRWLVPVLALLAGAAVALVGAAVVSGDDVVATGAGAAAGPRTGVDADPAAADPVDPPAGDADAAPADQSLDGTARIAPEVTWRATVDDSNVQTVLPGGDTTVIATNAGLYGLDPSSGERRWEHPVAGRDVSGVTRIGDIVIYRSVGVLEGLDVGDGEEVWVQSDQYTPDGNLTPTSGTLYGVGPGRIVPEIMAIDPTTGSERWHFHGEDVEVSSDAGIAAAADIVLIAQDGALIAFDPNAELGPSGANRREIEQSLWTVDIPEIWDSSVRLAVDQVLLVTTDGRVCSHARSDGTAQWCEAVAGADGPMQPVVLHDNDAVVVATRSGTTALGLSSGDVRWQVDSDVGQTRAAAVIADVVAVGERSGVVRGLSLDDGSERWRARAGKRVLSLSTDAEGALVAGTRDGDVVRFDFPADAS